MTGNAVAIGKRIGVQPTLARRTAAAGRNGKRLVTGDAENANRVIGKGLRVDKIRSALAARKMTRKTGIKPGFESMHTKDLDPLRPTNLRLPTGAPYTPSTGANGITLRPSRLQGYVNKAAPGTGGMGSLVPQFRGSSLKSLTPQAPSFAPKQQKAGGLVAAGGTKASAPSTAGLSGVGTASSSSGAASAGGAGGVGKAARVKLEGRMKGASGAFTGRRYRQGPKDDLASEIWDATAKRTRTEGGNVKVVRKRRYDPEDERRHRQGALAATGMLGGSALAVSGGRDIARDTRLQRGAPALLKPGMPPARQNGPWKDTKGKIRQPGPQERLGEDMAYDLRRSRHAARVTAHSRLANPKGVQVTGRAAGKLGGGLALVGAGAALHRRRREPRWD